MASNHLLLPLPKLLSCHFTEKLQDWRHLYVLAEWLYLRSLLVTFPLDAVDFEFLLSNEILAFCILQNINIIAVGLAQHDLSPNFIFLISLFQPAYRIFCLLCKNQIFSLVLEKSSRFQRFRFLTPSKKLLRVVSRLPVHILYVRCRR